MRVLVIEDDRRLAGTLRRGLAEAGCGVDWIDTGEAGLAAALATPFDAIVLDVMLSGRLDGIAVAQDLRNRRVRTPILMLTALDAVDDRVRGIEAGADDYLAKPFAFRELVARLRGLTRRHLDDRTAVLESGRLRLDTGGRRVTVGDHPVEMTSKETAILEHLMLHRGRLITRTQIEEHVWNYQYASESNLVEVYVGRIRRKLITAGLGDPITTIRGGGYRFDGSAPCTPGSGAPAPG